MWITVDGPVDAIWIGDLNTALNDNKILTLTNGVRIPMTDNVKIMFEVEMLVNASPTTVSCTGSIYVSDTTDLDWSLVLEAWVRKRSNLIARHSCGLRLTNGWVSVIHLIQALASISCNAIPRRWQKKAAWEEYLVLHNSSKVWPTLNCTFIGSNNNTALERMFVYCLCWSTGALLEAEDRMKFDTWLRKQDDAKMMPTVQEGETIYEYFVNCQFYNWWVGEMEASYVDVPRG